MDAYFVNKSTYFLAALPPGAKVHQKCTVCVFFVWFYMFLIRFVHILFFVMNPNEVIQDHFGSLRSLRNPQLWNPGNPQLWNPGNPLAPHTHMCIYIYIHSIAIPHLGAGDVLDVPVKGRISSAITETYAA